MSAGDSNADQGDRMLSSMIALIVLPTIFVILRIASRKISQAGFWWDDALVLGSLLLCYGPCVSVIVGRRDGFGKHSSALKDSTKYDRMFFKMFYIYLLFYYSAVVCVKLAILTFYRRIFPFSEIKLKLYLAYLVVAGYAIGTLTAATFRCQPIHAFWDVGIPHHCTNAYATLMVPGALNVVLDFAIVALPLPLVWKLRTTSYQKWVLTGIFACAGFVCIISIIRLVVLNGLVSIDVTWNYVNSSIWTAAEPCMGVIASCLPSLRPLLSLLFRGTTRATGTLHSNNPQNTSSSHSMFSKRARRGDEIDLVPTSGGGREGFARLGDDERGLGNPRWGHEIEVKGGREKKSAGFPGLGGTRQQEDETSLEEIIPQGGIKVKSEVVVTSTEWEWKDRLY